jgi:transcriptional regulator with XRE-family HTH domain
MPRKTQAEPPLTLGQRLRAARKTAGLTQKQAAKRAGVFQASISCYERGKTAPSFEVLRKLARAYGVSCGWLLD